MDSEDELLNDYPVDLPLDNMSFPDLPQEFTDTFLSAFDGKNSIAHELRESREL